MIFLTVNLLILSSCGSQKRMVNKYYVIEKPAESSEFEIEGIRQIDQYCEIIPVDVYPAFASQKVALRSGEYEIIYYSYHQWAVRPSESFTRIIQDYLNHIKLFKEVSTRFWRVTPEYVIKTTIYKLEVIQEGDNLFAHLEMEFSLEQQENDKRVIQHKADRKELLPSKDLNLFAKSIGAMFYEELYRFSQKILKEAPVE